MIYLEYIIKEKMRNSKEKQLDILIKHFKQNGKKKIVSKNSGITLIALVITIIVLLILASVSISAVFSQDGIFSRAEKSANKYNQAKARETLEILLNDAQIQKYEEGLTEEQLDRKIQEIGELLPKEDPNPNIQDVIVEGYIFKVDKSVPKIIEFVDRADGIIITAVLSNNATDGWLSASQSDVNIKGKIMTYSGGKITTVRAKSGETPISGFSIDKDGLYEINHITDSSIITIEAEDSKGKTKSKEINVEVKIDKTAPTVETVNATVEGRKIKLSATGHDRASNGEEQSGIKEFNYTITPAEGVDKASGTFSKNGTAEINVTNWALYTIKVTATDKCGNTTETPKEQTADIRDVTPPTIETVNVEVERYTINLSATGHDRDATGQEGSGIANFSYTITPVDGLSKTSGIFGIGETAIITSSLEKTYTITVNAVDNASNPTTTGKQVTAITSDAMSVKEAKRLITSMSALKEHMGEKVAYKQGETWQIFYYDEDGDFGPKKTLYLKKAYDKDNKTILTLSTKTESTNQAVDRFYKMNPEWAKAAHSSINNNNEKACVWLCDPEVWNTQKNDIYSSYAIGSPSVEMYMKAYNVWKTGNKNETNLVYKVESSNGYSVGSSGTYSNSGHYTNYNTIETGLENIFMDGNGFWWLASPSASANSSVLRIFGPYAYIRPDTYSVNTNGTCPIVPLDL